MSENCAMKIVCFGDSLTCCGGAGGSFCDVLQDRFPTCDFVNAGIDGDTIADAVVRLKRDVIDLRPDVTLVEFGANDWWRDERPVSAWIEDMRRILYETTSCGAAVAILGVFGPCRDATGIVRHKDSGTDERGRAWFDAKRSLAEEFGCRHLWNVQESIIHDRSCWIDSNHPNEYGNRYVADTIEPILVELTGYDAVPTRKPEKRSLPVACNESVAKTFNDLANAAQEGVP